MKEISKEEMDKTIEEYGEENEITWDMWLLLLLPLMFGSKEKSSKVINIYLGDDK